MLEKWGQVKELFALALERDPKERSDFLREACAGDDPLRTEIESLLSSFDGATNFLEDCHAADLVSGQSRAMAGRRVGRTASSARLGTVAWRWFIWASA